MERNFEDGVHIHRLAAAKRGLEYPLGERFLGTLVQPWIEAFHKDDAVDMAILANHAEQTNLSIDAIGRGRGDVFRVDFPERDRRAENLLPRACVMFGEPDSPASGKAGHIGHLE